MPADMNINVAVTDDRRIEVVANGLPLWHGSQQAVDATIVSPVTRNGKATWGRRPARLGALWSSPPQTAPNVPRACARPSLPLGGRWGRGRGPIRSRNRHLAAPACAPQGILRPRAAWVTLWSGLLAVAVHSAFAASLLELPLAGGCSVAGEAPELHGVFFWPMCAGSSPSLPAGRALTKAQGPRHRSEKLRKKTHKEKTKICICETWSENLATQAGVNTSPVAMPRTRPPSYCSAVKRLAGTCVLAISWPCLRSSQDGRWT